MRDGFNGHGPLHWSGPTELLEFEVHCTYHYELDWYLQANYRLNKYGMRLLPPGWRSAPRASKLNRQGFDYSPKVT